MNPLHIWAVFNEPEAKRRPDGDRLERGRDGTTQVRGENGVFSAKRVGLSSLQGIRRYVLLRWEALRRKAV